MFIGHFAIGMAAKSLAPKPSLGTYFAAVSFLDLLWPLFLLLGIEHVEIDPGNTPVTPLNFVDYPWSHSLVMTLAWALLFATVYYFIRRDAKGWLMLFIAVTSHWVLDAITHRPDLQLLPGGSARVGLGLWYSVPATMIVECIIFVAGVLLYTNMTRAKDKTGTFAFWSFIAVNVILYLGNIFGPPPSNPKSLAWFAQAGWLVVLWGWWIDKHRVVSVDALD